MEFSSSDMQRIEKQFDHFCKIVIVGKKKDIYKHDLYILRHEKSFSELTFKESNRLYATDKYNCFGAEIIAAGFLFEIENELLFAALNSLPENKKTSSC